MCFIGAFETHYLGKIVVRLTNTSGSAVTAKTWVYSADSGGSGGTVTVDNFPTSFDVSNFPSSQNVVCTSGCTGGGGSGGEVQIDPTQNTVQLADGDRERLDLGWWGTWAIVGLMLVLMIAPAFSSVLRITRGM